MLFMCLPGSGGGVEEVGDVYDADDNAEQEPQVGVHPDHRVFGLSQGREEEQGGHYVVDHNLHSTELILT